LKQRTFTIPQPTGAKNYCKDALNSKGAGTKYR